MTMAADRQLSTGATAENAITLAPENHREIRQLGLHLRLEHARDESKRAETIIRRLDVGDAASALERLDAEGTLAITEDALASAQARLAEDRVRVFLALGGGWTDLIFSMYYS